MTGRQSIPSPLRELSHHPLVDRIVVLGAAVILWFVTITHLDVIAAGLRSFLIAILLLPHPSVLAAAVSVQLLAIWLASIVWVPFTAMVTLEALKPGFTRQIREPLSTRMRHSETNLPHTHRWRLGCWMLVVIAFVAVEAPILRPTDSLAQGELQATRLKAPLSLEEMQRPAEYPGRAGAGVLERTLTTDLVTLGLRSIPGDDVTRPRQPFCFLLGSDSVGRDVLSRLIDGTRVSLTIGCLATLAALLLGGSIGFLAGYLGRLTDRILMWLVDVFLSIPSLFLVIMFAFFLGTSLLQLIAVLALSGWMGVARVVRGEVLHLRQREFVLAARLFGQSRVAIFRRHLLPNILPAVLSAAILLVSDTILGEAALSFLGYGVQPPTPSWGNTLGEAVTHLDHAWWLALFPGLALFALLFALHLVAEELQHALKD